MAKAWATGVNTKAYGMDTGYEENSEVVEMKSGRKVSYLKNSIPRKVFSFSLMMTDDGVNSEYRKFLYWYENTCHSGADSFLFPNLITHSGNIEYRFTSPPSARGQLHKEVSIECEEV